MIAFVGFEIAISCVQFEAVSERDSFILLPGFFHG
jgi:hypothetical protein